LCGDEAVVRIAGGVAPLGERSVVAGLLQLQFEDALLFPLDVHLGPFRRQRRFDRQGLDSMDELPSDRRVDT
jgi:hypothetical protein